MKSPRRCKHDKGFVSCKECRNYDPRAAQINGFCLECVHAFARSSICNYTELARSRAATEGS